MSGSWLVAATAVAVLAGGLLVGCGTEPDVDPTPTVEPTTVTPEPEPEPTEDAPEEPEAPLPRTGTPDEYDAEDAGEFFLRLYEYTLATGDTEQWQARSEEECGFCANVMDSVERNQEKGARFVGVNFTFGQASFVAYEEVLRMFAVEVPYEVDQIDVVSSDGEVLDSYPSGSGYLLIDIGYAPNSGWMLRTGGSHEGSHL